MQQRGEKKLIAAKVCELQIAHSFDVRCWQNSRGGCWLHPLAALALIVAQRLCRLSMNYSGHAHSPMYHQILAAQSVSQAAAKGRAREYIFLSLLSRCCWAEIYFSPSRALHLSCCCCVGALWKIESSARVLFACVRIFLASSCHAIVCCLGFYWANLHFCLHTRVAHAFC